MKKVDETTAVRLVDESDVALAGLPDELAVTLGGIAELCREGLMAVAVEAGLATAAAIMAEEVTGLVGGWNARDPHRSMERGGTTPTSVVMGGQRLPIRRPRVQAVDDSGEVGLESFKVFAQGDLLNRVVIERMLAGVGDPGLRAGRGPDRRDGSVEGPVDVEELGVATVRDRH